MPGRYLLLAGFAWLACAAALAAPPASPVTLTYSLSRNGLTLADVTDTLAFGDRRFEIKSNGRGAGLLALISRVQMNRSSDGEILAGGLRPLHYRESRGNNERLLGADFDWSTQLLDLSDNGQHEHVELPAGSLDRLSFPYSFSFLPKTPARWRLAMTDGRRLTDYQFRLVGKETIDTPIGEQRTLRYSRIREGDDPVFDLWLGVDQHLLPLRIVFTDKDGARFEQVITRIDYHAQ
jgi:hypothetical protein